MGRYWVRLDPDGYSYCSEPGAHFQWVGPGLFKGVNWQRQFYVAPDSDWLMPNIAQFDGDWYKSVYFKDGLVDLDHWNFPGSSPTQIEFVTRKPDGTSYPSNKWISLRSVPSGLPDLDLCNFTRLFGAASLAAPSGFKTIGFALDGPGGERLDEQDYGPCFSWASWPSPDELLVFGFADIAFLVSGDAVYVLRTPNLKQDWVLQRRVNPKTAGSYYERPKHSHLADARYSRGGMPRQMEVRSIMAFPVGRDHMAVHFGDGAPVLIRLRTTTSPNDNTRLFEPGSWWVAAAPKQRLLMQAQMVMFEGQALSYVGDPQIDFGGVYKPTAAPSMNIEYRLPGNTVKTRNSNSVLVSSDVNGMQVIVDLQDETGGAWTSDGTHSLGKVGIQLAQAALITYGPLAPQVRLVEVKFPRTLAPRLNDELLLDDTHCAWEFENDLRDPKNKSITLHLTDLAEGVLGDLADRDDFPVHIEEDTDDDGIPDTVRVKGWVRAIDLQQHADDGPDLALPIRDYTLHGGGLLSRADQAPLFLPTLVDPDGDGYVEHFDAVGEKLRQAAFDPSDDEVYAGYLDPQRGTALSRLPGTWGFQNPRPGAKVDNAWGQDWDEGDLDYILRIAREWAGWVLYEEHSGLIRYHPDLSDALFDGRRFYRAGTIYQTQEAAEAAGKPYQWYTKPSRTVISPRGTAVRVTGQDSGTGETPHIIERHEPGISDLGDENFVGRIKPVPLVSKLAVKTAGQNPLRKLARVKLRQIARRLHCWTIEVPMLAPWEFETTTPPLMGQTEIRMEPGTVWEFEGRGDFLIIHVEAEELLSAPTTASSRSIVRTRITGERVPLTALAGGARGGYPGLGKEVT